jgi:hypothetical protein
MICKGTLLYLLQPAGVMAGFPRLREVDRDSKMSPEMGAS